MLGFESRYRLERLSGRYADIQQQNSSKGSAFDLLPELFVDFFPTSGVHDKERLLIDTLYGSSIYMEIDTTKRYRIFKTEDALIVRSEERAIPISQEGVLTISITKACETKTSLIDSLSKVINRWAIKLF